MNRRNTLLALAALGAWPYAADAQQAGKVWRIGILRPGPDDAVFRENFDPFLKALRDSGFTEGTNLAFEFRVHPGNPEEMLGRANELVRAKVDAILAVAGMAVSAATKATTSIPILAIDMESDAVAEKFAASLARPGGNLTGLFLDFPEMGGKWIQLLKETMPKLTRVAVLWDPSIGTALMRGAEAGGISTGVKTIRLEARSPAEFASAVDSAVKQKAEALLVLGSPAFNSARKQIAELTLKHRLPAIMIFPGFAADGGLMAYGPNLPGLYGQIVGPLVKILKGARPAEIAIERPTRFEMVINMKTAKALGITIPQSLRLRADRIIE